MRNREQISETPHGDRHCKKRERLSAESERGAAGDGRAASGKLHLSRDADESPAGGDAHGNHSDHDTTQFIGNDSR